MPAQWLARHIQRAASAVRSALGAFLASARTALGSQGLDAWPSDGFAQVPAALEPFLVEAFLHGAGGLADLKMQADEWGRRATERIAASHWPSNTYAKLAQQALDQWPVLLDLAQHERWAKALAASEARSAFNAGAFAAALANNAERPMIKVWKTTLDGRARHAHQLANGQRIPVTEPFLVGGESLMFPGDPTTATPGMTANCRCQMRLIPAPLTASTPSGVTMNTPAPQPAGSADDIWWEGPLAPIGVESADMRRLAATEQLETRELPLPLLFQRALKECHEGAVQGLAVLREAYVKDGVLHGRGTLDGKDPDAVRIADKIERGYLGWVSVDLDKARMELDDTDPAHPVEVATSWRLTGATLVGQPAFDTQAKIRITGKPAPADAEAYGDVPVAEARVKDEVLEEIADPPIDTAADESQDDRSETEGPRAAGTRKASEHPGSHTGPGADDDLDEEGLINQPLFPPKPKPKPKVKVKRAAASLIAAAIPVAPPKAWFDDPQFTEPTAMQVTARGQVRGHLATWDRPHMSAGGGTIRAPHSPSAYREFHVGSVLTVENELLAVGTLTAGTSHAEHGLTPGETMAFYSDTGYGAAVVRAGEDAHGIWVAGALTPNATEEQIAALRRAPLSGDWRDNGLGLDLVAALAVNRPAFPVLRASAYLEGGLPRSLVAAGALTVDDSHDAFDWTTPEAGTGLGEVPPAFEGLAASFERMVTALEPLAASARWQDEQQRSEREQQIHAVRQRFNAARTARIQQRMQTLRTSRHQSDDGDPEGD
ncbi:phage minor head protein [Streptomyces sp. LHD-70]|uniref:phage minor head protein n=1 Tax=Streptomyces sp. LHD-70 TaxID=3072140 RepID=UPI00280D0428|nr:phage minor head protein [Streptomyces sp. LHD-70]MDQ8706204.1 phage minor head protein [Streptomyces sp. LHD-70]